MIRSLALAAATSTAIVLPTLFFSTQAAADPSAPSRPTADTVCRAIDYCVDKLELRQTITVPNPCTLDAQQQATINKQAAGLSEGTVSGLNECITGKMQGTSDTHRSGPESEDQGAKSPEQSDENDKESPDAATSDKGTVVFDCGVKSPTYDDFTKCLNGGSTN